MKRVIAIAIGVLGLLAGAIGVSYADAGEHNDHGLCTAYFNGQKVGHGPGEDQDNQPPPFQGLEDASREYTDSDGEDNDNDGETDEEGENTSLTDAENIFNYCNDTLVIGGNPEHGRFTCTDPGTAPQDDPQTDPECDRNDKPGNG